MGKIFEELKQLSEYEYEIGKEELKYLYFSENLSITEQLDLVDYLADTIINMYEDDKNKEKISSPKFHLEEIPLIYYMNPLINKINILIKEGLIEKSWVEKLTYNLIYNSEDHWEVKLGLILSSNYFAEEKLQELFNVFSKSGEYIFYLMNTVRNLNKYNNYLVELSKKTKGTIKVFAITNIEYFSLDIISYMVEEGYKDEIYEDLLIYYILTTINLEKYLDKCNEKSKLDNLSFLICSYLRNNEFSKIRSKYELIEKFIPLISRDGDNYENLNSLYLLKEGIMEDEKLECDPAELEKEISKLLEDEKWISIYKNTIKEGCGLSEGIINLADFYEYKLDFEDLLPYLKRDYKDIYIYCYLVDEGSKEDKIKLLNFFKNHFNIDEYCNDIRDIEDDELKEEDTDYIIFSLIIKSLRDIYPYGKDIAIKALSGRINKIRNESIKFLKRYRKEIGEIDEELIKKAYNIEPNYKIKQEIETLISGYKQEKKEYINIDDVVTYEHVGDVYLLNTEVLGCQFRHRETLEDELENSNIINLVLEESGPYNDKTIKAIGESGFVLGYISMTDNYILSNLLRGGKYLYGKIEKYNLENNCINIRVYLSYKDVIESINDTILMLHGGNSGEFLN